MPLALAEPACADHSATFPPQMHVQAFCEERQAMKIHRYGTFPLILYLTTLLAVML